tara:strand:- start:69 stop:377 length:309 start_codon:yes stop_codon:yes gene_type:complete
MSTQDVANYIIKNLKKGYTLDSLRFSLISQGYTKITVENAIDIANKKLAEQLPEVKERPEITYKVIAESEELANINQEDDYQETETKLELTNKKGFFGKLFG